MSTGDDELAEAQRLADLEAAEAYERTRAVNPMTGARMLRANQHSIARGLAAKRAAANVVPIKAKTPEREEYLRRKASNPVSAAMFLQRVGRAAIFPDDDGSDGGGKAA